MRRACGKSGNRQRAPVPHHTVTHAATKHTRRNKKSGAGEAAAVPFVASLVSRCRVGHRLLLRQSCGTARRGGRRRVRGGCTSQETPSVSEEHRAAAAQRRLRASTNRVLPPEARTGRAPAPRAPRPCEQQPMGLRRCANGPQPTRPSLAAEEASAKRPYGACALAHVHGVFVPSGASAGIGCAADLWQSCGESSPCGSTWLAQVTSALRTCRAVQADGSERAWGWATERTHGPALTRPTGRSLVIVGSSPHAAGQSRDGSASALDTVLRRPVTGGPKRDASATQGAVRPAETSTCGLLGKKVASSPSLSIHGGLVVLIANAGRRLSEPAA